jgi:predicted lipoprotein with Yx(FWY)xxD motif
MFWGERDMHTASKTAVVCDKPTANVLNQRRRSRPASSKSIRHAVDGRMPRPAGQRPAGTPPLVRLGWSISAVAGLTLLAAGCASGGYASPGTGSYGTASHPSSGPPPAAIVDLRASRLGQTLVDGQGRTLYLFEADRAGKSECDGGCATAWPPVIGGGTPQAGTGVTGALLGTTIRRDGGVQVTYGGHPLYRYAGDSKPGDVTGQGLDQFGAKWYVIGAGGNKIDID